MTLRRILLLAVVVGMMTAIVLAVFVGKASTVRKLDEDCAKAHEEVRRLEYVLARNDELAKLQAAIARRDAGDATAEPAPRVNPFADLGNPPPPPRSPFDYSQAIRDRRAWLDDANALIQKGINLEKRLPRLEADVAAAERRLAEQEAKAP